MNTPTVVLRNNDFDLTSPGTLASRTPSGWTMEPTPFPFPLGIGSFDPAGRLQTLILQDNIGADPSVEYVAHDSSGWSSPAALPDIDGFSNGIWVPRSDCILTAGTQRSQLAVLEKTDHASSWTKIPLANGSGLHGALSANGRPEYVWNDYDASPVSLRWQGPPDPAQIIPVTIGEQVGPALIAIVGGANDLGQPQLLYTQGRPGFESDPGTSNLMYATRSSTGDWSTSVIVSDDLGPNPGPCSYGPTPPPGTMCSQMTTVHVPAAVVASDNGDVRLLFITRVSEYSLNVDSTGHVSTSVSTVSEKLEMAWPVGSGFGRVDLFDADTASRPCAGVCDSVHSVLDAAGTIHLLIIGAQLRYVQLAP